MGFTRAELESFRDVEVPDLLPGPGQPLRLLFVGINPGLWTAATQTHFARPGNRFYPALLRAGILTEPVDAVGGDDCRGPGGDAATGDRHHQRGGARHRARRRASTEELRRGGEQLRALVAERHPVVVAVAGITAYRTAFGERGRQVGEQPEPWGASRVFVVPNPSGLNAHETVDTLAAAYAEAARAAGVLGPAPGP